MCKRIGLFCFIIIVVSISVSGKGLSHNQNENSGTLIHGYYSEPMMLNPILSNDFQSRLFRNWCSEFLARENIEDPDELLPELAESWEFDREKLLMTINLRQGVKWHSLTLGDGTIIPSKEFTADDVKFTFDVVLNPGVFAAHHRNYVQDIEYVKKIDKYTVEIKWGKPYFLMLENTLNLFEIIPRHVYGFDEDGEPLSLDVTSSEFAEAFNRHWFNDKLIGTGPVKFKEYVRNKHVILEKNNEYYGRTFHFNRVIWKKAPDIDAQFYLLLKDEMDFVNRIKPLHSEKEAVELTQFKKGTLIKAPYDFPAYSYIGWNLNNPIFRDKKVRWALSHAINADEILQKIYYGLGKRTSGPFLPHSPIYDPSIEPVRFDLDESGKLLEEAGWKDSNGNGTIDKSINGNTVEFEFEFVSNKGSNETQRTAEYIQGDLRKLGIKMNINLIDWSLMLEKLRKREFGACMLMWVLGWKQDPYQLWHSSQADAAESSNHIAYRNQEVDGLIDELRVTFDKEKQLEIYHKIHRLIHEDQPYMFLFTRKFVAMYNSRLNNVKLYKVRPNYNLFDWYVPQGQIRAN